METCLLLDNVSKRYGRTLAVDSLCLELRRGEVMGLLGPNGAGKSTTLGMVSGLVRRSSGRIEIFGLDADRRFMEVIARMGVLVERPAFPEYLTVRRVLKWLARLSGKTVSVDWALRATGLDTVSGMKVGRLSQGMRQRLGIAQAILAEPELLVLDEPTSGLDVESTRETLAFLRKLADEVSVAILFSSHQMAEVEMLCDRVAVMRGGRLTACERTAAVLSWDFSRLEVLCDRAEEAAAALAAQPWVTMAEALPAGVRVTLREEDANRTAAFLVSGGFHVRGIVPKRRTLEEYFLKATRP